MRFDPRLNNAWWTLRIGLGLTPILAGLDKYFSVLTNWEMYLNPLIPRLLHPDAHTRDCALTCAKSGFGIIDKDGTYLKLDAKGNADAMKLLQSTTRKDHLRVNVTGEKQGDIIQVQLLKM